MRITDLPEFRDKKNVMSFEASTPLSDAIAEMAYKNYGACIVTEKGKLAGIFTERDLLRRVVAQGVDVQKTKLRDVMSTDLKTAKEDDLVADSLRRMSQGRFRHLPVTDENDNVIGMLSQGDFVAFTMSDVAHRLSSAAKAGVEDGSIKPLTMILSIVLYTLGLLFLVSAVGHWFG